MDREGHLRSAEILLVEDSATDVLLAKEALRSARVANRLHVVGDGEAALRFLRREEPFAEAPRPDVVLLDLNLPGVDGREVLAAIKADPELAMIPVVVLTTSRAEADVVHSYSHHVNCYIVKPIDFQQFVDALRVLERFWLQVVTLPPQGPGAGSDRFGLTGSQ